MYRLETQWRGIEIKLAVDDGALQPIPKRVIVEWRVLGQRMVNSIWGKTLQKVLVLSVV